jgi:hypothetical protein
MENTQTQATQKEKLPDYYYQGDFPLDDCKVTIVKKEGQWSLSIYAPEKYEHKGPLESYRPYSLEKCFYELVVGRKIYAAEKEAFKLKNRTAETMALKDSQIACRDLAN